MDDVTVISKTIQEYEGKRYYLCGHYFQRKGVRLHRKIWEDANGEIPKGYNIHHIDGDCTHNTLENLMLMDGKEHMNHHARTESRRENGRRAIKMAIEVAPDWHRSKEGKEWHSRQSKKTWENRKPRTFVCDMCGKEFQSTTMITSGRHFCHSNCKAKHLRLRRKGLA